jgi:hypothetical protein
LFYTKLLRICIEQQADKSTLGGGMQAIQGDNNTQEDNSTTQTNQGNSTGIQVKAEGGENYAAKEIKQYNNAESICLCYR